MFCKKEGPPMIVRQYLGLFGKAGLGKTTICCEAMFQYMQGKHRGRYCRVKLTESDKAADGKGADERSADGKKRQERIKLAIQQLVGLPKDLSKVMSEREGLNYLATQLRGIQQPVFLVVDNVTENSLEEAKWYANAEWPSNSYVLVTSRSREILEIVLGGKQYCKEFPQLTEKEAEKLFLSKALSTDISREHTNDERQILQTCLSRCCIDKQYIPRSLMKFAFFLHTKGDILSWKNHIADADSILRLEYDNLDDVSKLIFLDLAIFAHEMSFTHMDFHDELDWVEHDNSKLVVDFIAMLHGISPYVAKSKVNGLRSSSFLKDSMTKISVSDDYKEFAQHTLLNEADGVEKKWCMVSTPEGEMDYVNGMVRVFLAGIRFDPDLYKIRKWRTVKFLFLYGVRKLPKLDLKGLRSLRVLRVIGCYDLEKIVCSCNSASSEGLYCYQKERGCLTELRVVQLEYLPKLREASFPMHSWKLETLWFYECPNVTHFPNLHFCSKLKRFRLPCGDFKGFQGLRTNQELTELAFHWETDTVSNFTEDMRKNLLHDVMNLTNLTVLDIVDEREVYDWIPAGFCLNVGRLVLLTFLDLSCATSIEEVEGLEQLSHLTSLGLYGCCELRKLPDIFAKLKKLKRLCIGHCHKLDLSTQTSPEDGSWDIEAFHALGESCAFGAHECLDHCSESDEQEARSKVCKLCDEDEWNLKYTAKDQAKPPKDVDVCPEQEGSSGKTITRAPILHQVSNSMEKDEDVFSAIPPVEVKDDKPDDSLNILLLGESGVGKSTFINALCNYLKFPTLDEARRGEMQGLIYSEFIASNDDGDEIKIVVGTPNDDEGARNKGVGGSCTQKCKAYTFPIGEKKLIRLVDSPGIGDTRGFDQDIKNIKDILSFISRYERMNAICILLKPDQERLTISLRYCILELLAHLHKDASTNILFCFTNSRRTMFRVGGTKRLLTQLLSQSPQTAAIKLEKNTMYHFDSEGFRFLACVKNGLDFSEHESDTFRSSWKQSSDEAARLIQHIASLTPHDIQSTLSLNRVRDMLTTIEVPLAAISAAIQNNLVENRKVMKELLESQGNIADKCKNLVIREERSEMVALGHLRTICNSTSCLGKVCHDNCSPTETVAGVAGGILSYFSGEEKVFCEKLSLRKRKCRICKCPNNAHNRVSQEMRNVVREREDESVRKVIEKTAGDIEKMKEISMIYETREKSFEDEMSAVVNAAALFAGFLEQNSIITYHAATQEYLKDQIKKERHSGKAGKERIAELESLLDTYERQVHNFRNRRGPTTGDVQMITPDDVKLELKKLIALPRHGQSLQILMDDVDREYKLSALRHDEVAVDVPHVPSGKEASQNNSKSLLEKLAAVDLSAQKKLAS
ncbi:hypothetical protein KC19_2G122900 [Ceratodon purpureus]|nr:hypothetical protein KC19_2G122900 [Ceratodon purpureus]